MCMVLLQHHIHKSPPDYLHVCGLKPVLSAVFCAGHEGPWVSAQHQWHRWSTSCSCRSTHGWCVRSGESGSDAWWSWRTRWPYPQLFQCDTGLQYPSCLVEQQSQRLCWHFKALTHRPTPTSKSAIYFTKLPSISLFYMTSTWLTLEKCLIPFAARASTAPLALSPSQRCTLSLRVAAPP